MANLSPSLFGLWYSGEYFDTSIIIDNNRYKRRQTFGSVVKKLIRYRQVVTFRKVYTVATASWICSGIGFAPFWYFSPDRWIILSVVVVAVCLIISTYCYGRIFFRLRHQRTQVHNNLPEEENQKTRVDITRYRKKVSSPLWLQFSIAVLLLALFVADAIYLSKN